MTSSKNSRVSSQLILRVISITLLVFGLLCRFVLTGSEFTGYALIFIGILIPVYTLLKKRHMKKTCLVFSIVLGVGVLIFIAAETAVIISARSDPDISAKYIIVLGAGVDGDTPSVSLQNRLNAAMDYMQRHESAIAIVSGGQGSGENLTEAESMRIWLEKHDIAPERIIKEEQAASTQENLTYSFDIMRNRGLDPSDGVVIVSSEYHLCRAKMIAKTMGATPYVVAAPTTLFSIKLNYFIREAFAVFYTWMF